MKKHLPFLITVFCLTFNQTFSQNTWYVSTSGSDSNGGSNSTTDAFATIQHAHDAAADGDTIQISDGTYTETSIETTKTLTITGTSADGTIIQASASQPAGDGSDDAADMDIFKVKNGKTVTFKYLTMRHANTNNQNGGAIFATYNVNVIIENCNFFHNYTNWHGGAVYADGPSTVIKNSSFANNTAGGDGGAIMTYGAAGADPKQSFLLENCTIYNNHAGGKGGALNFTTETEFSLTNNTIAFNTTASDGRKGIYSNGNSVAATFTNNILWNAEGGGVDYGFDNDNPFPTAVANNNIISKTWIENLRNGANSITWETDPAATTANIDFGTFQDNGSGIYTLPISSTSIAKDAGDATTATASDARGYGKTGIRDIGAFEESGITLSAATNTSLTDVSIAPNPSNGTINIYNLDADTYELTVYGLNGAVLYSATQANSNIQLPANIKGLLFIKINTGSSTKVFKHLVK